METAPLASVEVNLSRYVDDIESNHGRLTITRNLTNHVTVVQRAAADAALAADADRTGAGGRVMAL